MCELPVSVGELIVLDGSSIVANSLKMLSIAKVGSLDIDDVTLLSKSHSLVPSAKGLQTRAGRSTYSRCAV